MTQNPAANKAVARIIVPGKPPLIAYVQRPTCGDTLISFGNGGMPAKDFPAHVQKLSSGIGGTEVCINPEDADVVAAFDKTGGFTRRRKPGLGNFTVVYQT